MLTAIGLTPGGSSTVHIYTKQYIEQNSNIPDNVRVLRNIFLVTEL